MDFFQAVKDLDSNILNEQQLRLLRQRLPTAEEIDAVNFLFLFPPFFLFALLYRLVKSFRFTIRFEPRIRQV